MSKPPPALFHSTNGSSAAASLRKRWDTITGLGKSWIACALGHKACRDGRRVGYYRVPKLFEALAIARGDGRHAKMLKAIERTEWCWQTDANSSQLGQGDCP